MKKIIRNSLTYGLIVLGSIGIFKAHGDMAYINGRLSGLTDYKINRASSIVQKEAIDELRTINNTSLYTLIGAAGMVLGGLAVKLNEFDYSKRKRQWDLDFGKSSDIIK